MIIGQGSPALFNGGTMESKIILSFKNIVKVYPNGVVANKGISFDIEKNTIHALVGENGAGKTTLMKILFGIEKPQEGAIVYKGKEVHFKSPLDAIHNGIGMVHQHLMLAPDLTVAENLTLGIEPRKWKIFLDTRKAVEVTKRVSEEFGMEVPLTKKVRDLPIGIRQRVEILKALLRNAELLILDEPTAVLTPQETDVLFKTLRDLKKHGKTIIFISHKLKEVKAIADRVTVIRDGKVIKTKDAAELTEHQIAELMVGREIKSQRISPSPHIGESLLVAQDIRYINTDNVEVLKGVSFEVRSGEILGVAGVEGNGQTELVEILTGLRNLTSGKVIINGQDMTNKSPREIREKGVSHIPEDRMVNGVAENASIKENLISDRYYKKPFSKGAVLNWKYINEYSEKLIKEFNVLTQSPDTLVSALSGGNIQKVVVAREFSSNPSVIIADQPIRGIDVGSEELVHNLLKKMRDSGCAVFLVSADLDEVLKLSTRIIVLYNGEIVARFDKVDGLTGKDLGPYMLGVKKEGSTV